MNELEDIRKRSLIAIMAYLILYVVMGSIITLVLIKVFESDIYDYTTIQNAISTVSGDRTLDRIAAKINTWTMVLIYLPLSVVLITVMFKDLKEDFASLKEKNYIYYIVMIISAIAFFFISFGISKISTHFVGQSQNEKVLESVFEYKGFGVIMLLITSICGVIVEELIYRKAIFNLLKDKNRWIPILVSTIMFALPHVISTTNVGVADFIIICIPYFIAAFIFAISYEFSGRNIYFTISMHFMNNFITCMILLCN